MGRVSGVHKYSVRICVKCNEWYKPTLRYQTVCAKCDTRKPPKKNG